MLTKSQELITHSAVIIINRERGAEKRSGPPSLRSVKNSSAFTKVNYVFALACHVGQELDQTMWSYFTSLVKLIKQNESGANEASASRA